MHLKEKNTPSTLSTYKTSINKKTEALKTSTNFDNYEKRAKSSMIIFSTPPKHLFRTSHLPGNKLYNTFVHKIAYHQNPLSPT